MLDIIVVGIISDIRLENNIKGTVNRPIQFHYFAMI
jgi:hypothetical protein